MPGVQALIPAVAIRDDGTFGVLYYDMRNDTSAAATLIVDAWLATSADGVTWREQHLGGPFNFAIAPIARGLFIGDYMGLAVNGDEFVPMIVQTNASASPANLTDAYAGVIRSLPTVGDARGAKAAPYAARGAPALATDEALQARLSQTIRRVLDGRRVGGTFRRQRRRPVAASNRWIASASNATCTASPSRTRGRPSARILTMRSPTSRSTIVVSPRFSTR